MKPNLCNFNDVYILVRVDITIIGRNAATQAALKNCASLAKCITKTDGKTMDDADNFIMSMCNLLEYSSNYSDTTGISWFYSKVQGATLSNDNFDNFEW